jgi:hypothetical protein
MVSPKGRLNANERTFGPEPKKGSFLYPSAKNQGFIRRHRGADGSAALADAPASENVRPFARGPEKSRRKGPIFRERGPGGRSCPGGPGRRTAPPSGRGRAALNGGWLIREILLGGRAGIRTRTRGGRPAAQKRAPGLFSPKLAFSPHLRISYAAGNPPGGKTRTRLPDKAPFGGTGRTAGAAVTGRRSG